jgi:hypothetical protein
MNKTLEQLKYRIENNKYFTSHHVDATIQEVGELNREDCTIQHLLALAIRNGWLGKKDSDGFFESLIYELEQTDSGGVGKAAENRLWLMRLVPSQYVRR